jgi:hypothetical protein
LRAKYNPVAAVWSGVKGCASSRAMNSHQWGAACGDAIGNAALVAAPVKLVPKGIKATKRPEADGDLLTTGTRSSSTARSTPSRLGRLLIRLPIRWCNPYLELRTHYGLASIDWMNGFQAGYEAKS